MDLLIFLCISEYMLLHTSVYNYENYTYLEFLFVPDATSPLPIGLIQGYAFNTGVALILILTVMIISSLPFVRRGGSFEVFYWTHTLYLLFWILLIIHCKNFWKWFIGPCIIFLIEKV